MNINFPGAESVAIYTRRKKESRSKAEGPSAEMKRIDSLIHFFIESMNR
jgi:hypothetical protein